MSTRNTMPMKRCHASRGRTLAILLVMLMPMSCARDPLPHVPAFEELGFADGFDVVHQQLRDAYEELREKPRDAHRNGYVGMLLSAYGKYTAADVFYLRARMLAPEELRWVFYHAFALKELGRAEEAAEAFRKVLSLRPGRLSARLQLAEILFQNRDTQRAREMYEAISVEYPERVEGWLGLGKALDRLGDKDGALAALQRAARAGPRFGEVHYALALALREQGDEEAAAREFAAYERTAKNKISIQDPLMSSVIKLSAGDLPHMVRADQHLRRGQTDEAVNSYRAALAINGDNQDAWGGLVDALARADRIDDTGAAYREALDAGISYRRLHLTYGQALRRWRQLDAAREVIGRAIELDPRYVEALTALGEIELELGAGDAAVAQFRRAVSAAPHDRRVQLSLAQALNAAGRFESAAGELELLMNDPEVDQALTLKELALAYHGMQRADEAIETLRRGHEAARKAANISLVKAIDALLAEWEKDRA
ncbi:MAG: tetratricopeptide repeat protein [Gammaproteobacteria bacterium]|nr:tetratricopeptide repeat protein [Gammaproteobacteria bacterium]